MNIAAIINHAYINPKQPYRVLVVDPEAKIYNLAKKYLPSDLYIKRASTADTAFQMLGLQDYDLLILKTRLRLFSGIGFAERLKKLKPELSVLPIAEKITDAELKKIRSIGYPKPLRLPVNEDEFETICQEYSFAETRYRLNKRLRLELQHRFGFDQMISLSAQMHDVCEKILKVAGSRVPVLITGDSGTGKELVAKMIHHIGDRDHQPFLTVNCAAVPEGLLESQFFGHEKGSFTGAVDRLLGKFELADNGTLLLDEIGEMSPALQAKLLRVLESGEFERVGGVEPIKVDVRLITATNCNLDKMVQNNEFRADLLYRINVFPIDLPSLSMRRIDVELLSYHFLRQVSLRNNRQVRYITPEAISILQEYPWPGNIRELENAVERAFILSDNIRLRDTDFPIQLEWKKNNKYEESIPKGTAKTSSSAIGIKPLKEIEREAISQALLLTDGNISIAARHLGIGRTTLYNKIDEYNLVVTYK